MNDQLPIEIESRNLQKCFGENRVLRGVDFQVRRHQVVALIGPSGSGKSTFLRCLNLLEMPDAGDILWMGSRVDYRHMRSRELSCHRKNMGMVFQHFHLFPHRNALSNVMEGPVHVLGKPVHEAREQGMELLRQVSLGDKFEAWPSELSGGQKQRVAIARALAMNPDVLLLDEVTSALDVEMVSGINDLLTRLAATGMTMVVVTHDISFAMQVAHRICFFDEGRIVESGTPESLIERAQSPRLLEFLSAVQGTTREKSKSG